jgi:hypothetical protein
MTGLLHRIRRRRTEEPAAAPDPSAPPAGTEPGDLAAPAVPSFRHRGRLRRRLRYLRRVRELGYRDVGGLVFDLRRFGRDEPALVAAKLDALTAVDAELRQLEGALGDRPEIVELREPGIGACSRCAALHASDARFCSSCGQNVGATRVAVIAPGTPAAIDPAVIAHAHAAPGTPAAVGPAVTAHADTHAAPVSSPALEPASAATPEGHTADEQPTTIVAPVTTERDGP